MSLDLGELHGRIGLDTKPFDKGVGSVMDTLRGMGGKMAGLLAVGAGAAGAAIGASVAAGINMEPALDKMSASLGLTVEQADKASYAAGVAYSHNWGASMDEAAAATGAVISSVKGMADASEDELIGMTEDALAFASAFDVDVTRAVQVAGQMMKTGLVDNAQYGLDLLTVALQKVPVAVREDVVDAADEYGPFFAQMGIKGEEAMSMLVAASEKGMYGIDKTGDAVKEFTIRATDMSKASGDAYKTLGMDQETMTKALLKGGDEGGKAFDKIVDGILKIKDPAKQSQAALALFGTPLEDLGTSEIPKFLGSLKGMEGGLGDTEDATMRMGAEMSNNAASNIETARRKIEMFAVDTIGGQVIPKLTELTAWLAENVVPALKGFGEWVQKNSGWLLPLGAALGTVAGAITLVSAATKAWHAIQLLMNIVLAANPLAIVILAIAALVAGLIVAYNTSETFRNTVDGAFHAIAEVGRWLWNNALAPMVRFIVNGFAAIVDGIGDFLLALGNIPGFGWAKDAGAMMKGAAKEARGLAEGIKDIPPAKSVKVTIGIHTIYTTTGVSSSGNTIYRTGNGAQFEANGGILHFAGGGTLPGYSPGVDDYLFYSPDYGYLGLSGGESVMVPEWTAAVGPSTVNRWNKAARTGGAAGLRKEMGLALGGNFPATTTPRAVPMSAEVAREASTRMPDTLVVVDADGKLIGRMRVEAKGVYVQEKKTDGRRDRADRGVSR